jgi:hypothetical protein
VQIVNSAKFIQDIASINVGLTYRGSLKQSAEGSVAVVQMKDIGAKPLETPQALARIHAQEVAARYLLEPGDIVFRSRGNDNSCALVMPSLGLATVIAPMMFIRIRDKSQVLPAYLHWWLNRPAIRNLIDGYAQGGTIRMIPAGSLADLPVDIPSLQTQSAVVNLWSLAQQESKLMQEIAQKHTSWLDANLAQLARNSRPKLE